MDSIEVDSFRSAQPMIYAYTTPEIAKHNGWTKVGYTEIGVEERVRQQCHTADVAYNIEWHDFAKLKVEPYSLFKDHDFHAYLENCNIERKRDTEWFHEKPQRLEELFRKFANCKDPDDSLYVNKKYYLREEQKQCVEKTQVYFSKGGECFLWNAKPRFGKTLTAYHLIRVSEFKNVLIVTNRPSVADSWANDFHKFMEWQHEYYLISENEEIRKGRIFIQTRESWLKNNSGEQRREGCITFCSLQDLKGSVEYGGKFNKYRWMNEAHFDLLIIDESQEGVDTSRTENMLGDIDFRHILYLSGTPFKALSDGRFTEEQIFNWSYSDEQQRKNNWAKEHPEEANPYEDLPSMEMFTYHMSNIIKDKVTQGIDISEEEHVNYAFDLNEFFRTERRDGNLEFVHHEQVLKFIHTLKTIEKYPFSSDKLRKQLSHTIWYLDRVDSAKALKQLLEEDDLFKNYEIVLAAGDGKVSDDEKVKTSALRRVREAIAHNHRTITLTVRQLTVGVTVPEWSGILMLCNLKSASAYIQAVFRVQNPCLMKGEDGNYLRKERAYVFDFDPARTLIIFDEFANNLESERARDLDTDDVRRNRISKLLNFFPVIGEDDQGKMIELDANKVLTIPVKLKSHEVVRHGFMSNFLFKNISNIFGAPQQVQDIINKLSEANKNFVVSKDSSLDGAEDLHLNEDGEIDIPNEIIVGEAHDIFGDKVYAVQDDIVNDIQDIIVPAAPSEAVDKVKENIDKVKTSITEHVISEILETAATKLETKKSTKNKIEKDLKKDISNRLDNIHDEVKKEQNKAKVDLDEQLQQAESVEQTQKAQEEYSNRIMEIQNDMKERVLKETAAILEEQPKQIVAKMVEAQEEEKKNIIEDKVRDHLRGFSRTIPSFLMAYGDNEFTLSNLDTKVEPQVFQEVTGITVDDFRFLRDGGSYTNPDTGEDVYFEGQLFDEPVFNKSVQVFLNKKAELADYFDEVHKEDIFDYIPPQKTNQIFTPRTVVNQMLDALENEEPGCFDNAEQTFADLYMKSGLFIAEVVKRLYRSQTLQQLYPDGKDRIRHILSKQVYGMAPTRIIYLIARNYILGFDESLTKDNSHHLVQADAAEAAMSGKLENLVNEKFD